jgi:N utilization substance protein A
VVVRALAREPGSRTKVAVASREPGVDPIGACVGPRGARNRAVVEELRGERVDVISWDEQPERFVMNALAPARVVEVAIDKASRSATCLVEPAQVSLAIGRGGENARLAARLTGLRIDIQPYGETTAAPAPPSVEVPS